MKFSADEMLGKLARWLRMSGVDVLYQRQISDEDLLRGARTEGRIILTRDTKLIRKLDKKEFLFISFDHVEEQIHQFYQHFPELMETQNPFTRCVECNAPLEPIEKEKVKDKVWPYVYLTQENFTTCTTCHRIYWKATHVEKIKTKLKSFLPSPSGRRCPKGG